MPPAPSILVVDDNAPALKATVRILEQAGYDVAQAVDGVSALRAIRARRFGLVLLDVVLPDLAGPEVLRQIHADPALAGVSVVLLSSMAIKPEQQAEGLDAGADGYITRPLANAELLARVRSHLRQRELTEQLRASEQQFSSAFVHAAIGMSLIAPDGRFLKVNRALCRILGYPEAELLARTFQGLTHPNDCEADLENMLRLLGGAVESCEREKRYLHREGSVVWALVSVSLVRDEAGRPLHFVSQVQDITARKLAEAALEKAHQELVAASRQAGMAEVATGVLHNVGNVLNSVNVSATLIADQVRRSKGANVAKLAALFAEHRTDLGTFLTGDPRGQMIPGYLATLTESLAQEQAELLTEIDHLRQNVGHVKDIVGMQQSYARTSGGIEPVALAELVEDALRMNASSLARHDVELVRDFQLRPVVGADKHKVMQVVVNLVRNAQLACDEGGRPDKRVTVRIAGDAQRAQISVSDNGVGIPAENLLRIFAHGFTTRQHGHGFGLHSCALAARELGGSLTVHSDGPGRGATFILELPCQPEAAAA